MKTSLYIGLTIISLFLTSCASILNSKFQKVIINTDDKCTVLIDGRTPKRTVDGKYLVSRDAKSKQITVKKDGYKDENLSIIQYKKSPYYAISIVPFAITLFPPFYDNMIRSRNYLSELSIKNQMIEIPNKARFSRILNINNITILPNTEEGQSKQYIQYRKFIKNKSLKNERDADMSISSSNLKSDIIALFENKGYVKLEENDLDKLYLNAIITNQSFKSFGFYTSGKTATQKDFGKMLYADLSIKWEVLSNDKNILFSYETNNKSGQFAFYDKDTQNKALSDALKDATEIGFLQLLKTDDFNKLLDNRHDKISNDLVENKIEENVSFINTEENHIDTISIVNKANILYLSKKNLELRASFRSYDGIGAVRKKSFLEMIEDVPELHSYAKSNMRLKRIGFASSLVKVYNDYKLSGESKQLNQDYYNSFGLITKKEYHQGPRKEILKTKLPIMGQIKQLQVTTNHYTNSILTSSTTGENYKFKFTYGNTEYKKGFLLKNLKMAIGDDKEALKYIQKYRANWIARQSLKVFAVAATGFSLMVADNQKPFGISSEATPFVAIPTLGVFTWAFSLPQRYKTKNITNAINTYNKNLK